MIMPLSKNLLEHFSQRETLLSSEIADNDFNYHCVSTCNWYYKESACLISFLIYSQATSILFVIENPNY